MSDFIETWTVKKVAIKTAAGKLPLADVDATTSDGQSRRAIVGGIKLGDFMACCLDIPEMRPEEAPDPASLIGCCVRARVRIQPRMTKEAMLEALSNPRMLLCCGDTDSTIFESEQGRECRLVVPEPKPYETDPDAWKGEP